MPARSIDGPAEDWLDMAGLTRATGLSESTIKRLIASGEFPDAHKLSPKMSRWYWTDVVYWSLRMGLRHRLKPADPKKLAELEDEE